jgi:hypothetical protein
MRIFDINNIELVNPDLSRGYLVDDKIFVKRHEAIVPVEERWHYEVIAEYPNGGKDIQKVIDVVGVEAKDAWDEYEDIQRYIEYTADELLAMEQDKNKPTFDDRLKAVEAAVLELILGGNDNDTIFSNAN